ncbi:vitamin K-dependent protein C-like isoform X2 [Trichoplusia ni]|nr:vitamin K-dependent protein C-like isoform X2 [Trichoplusia ni]
MWERLHCASDSTQEMPEGIVSDIGRFPWLGIVQHSFYVAGKTHFAVTGAVLVHPAFAIAPAEDIAKISPDQLINNTKLILWGSKDLKYALDVKDVMLHPQYHEKVTFATIALLDLVAWGENEISEWRAPVLPICMPVKGFGTFDDIFAVKMTDVDGNMQKEIIRMNYIDDRDCAEFYYRAGLTYGKMTPVNPICAVSQFSSKPCVWDGGTALITRQSWGFWKLLGFAVRGPGCGAPTRFLNVHDYLPWINDVITDIPLADFKDTYKLGLRRVSPIKLVMYKANMNVPKSQGQCDKKSRGGVLYKDSSELVINRNFVQGFFFLVISQIAEFLCAEVSLDVNSQTNAAVWLEHNCHHDSMGLGIGQDNPSDRTKASCFIYYKTSAFVEFRFFFSFKAVIEVAMYGTDHMERLIPNPFMSSQHTTPWWPTPKRMRFNYFVPENVWWYSM